MKVKAQLSLESKSAWYESSTRIVKYSNKLSKWLGQVLETLSTAVMPICLSSAKLAESFSQPSTRCGRISTGGPYESSVWGVWRHTFCLWPLWKEMGRLALTEMETGDTACLVLAGELSQRVGNCEANAANPPVHGRERYAGWRTSERELILAPGHQRTC